MKRYAYGGLLLLLLLGSSSVGVAQEIPPAEAPAPAAAEETAAVQSCADCHDQAKAFVANPHARGFVTKGAVSNDSCATCHGDGTEHMEAGGDKTKIVVPRGRTGSDETCLLCHEPTRGGMHANTEQVNCLTCHSVHSSDPRSPHLVAKPQLALCATCHTQTAAMRNKPYTHRLDRGGMTCSSCHDPHGRRGKGERSLALAGNLMSGHLRTTRAGEAPCVSCHTEKKGPFVFAHGGAEVGECTTCHEAHGSSNPMMLRRATIRQVCIECHSPVNTGTVGSQPPSFHNLALPRYQNCTTCHTAVHGSNRDPQLLK